MLINVEAGVLRPDGVVERTEWRIFGAIKMISSTIKYPMLMHFIFFLSNFHWNDVGGKL